MKLFKKILKITGLVIVFLFLILMIIGSQEEYNQSQQTLNASKTTAATNYQCWGEASNLDTEALSLYSTLLSYQNADEQVDDYTAGTVNAAVAQYNSDVATYNTDCSSSAATAPIQNN